MSGKQSGKGYAWVWWQIDLLGVVAIGALTAVAYVSTVQPLARRRAALNELRGQLEETETRARQIEAVQSRLTEELRQAREHQSAQRIVLQPPDHLNHRMAGLVALASESGMQIDETTSGSVRGGQWYDTVSITLSGKGRYPEFADFLHRVSENLADVEVLAFELSGNPAVPGSRAEFRFDLAWYAASPMASVP